MGKIELNHKSSSDVTLVSNRFIDQYLPAANGEYVKLYLYLLRQVSEGNSISSEDIADLFDYTENDIRRGLTYWQKQGILSFELDAEQTLTAVTLLDLAHPPAPSLQVTAPVSRIPVKDTISPDRLQVLLDQAEIKQILFVAESYLGKTLSPAEINSILYYFLTLHFSSELVEYLIEYCVSRGNKSFHYMDKVAVSWAESGIRTVREAKESSSLYSKKYYQVLNTFGIRNRAPGRTEIDYINRWYDELHFTTDIIEEACTRTIAQTQKPNFTYADKILSSWKDKNVHHLSDIRQLDILHQKHQANSSSSTAVKQAASKNKFNNFDQRNYDFKELESQLLNQ